MFLKKKQQTKKSIEIEDLLSISNTLNVALVSLADYFTKYPERQTKDITLYNDLLNVYTRLNKLIQQEEPHIKLSGK